MSGLQKEKVSISFKKDIKKNARPSAELFFEGNKEDTEVKTKDVTEAEEVPWLQVGLVVRIENERLANGKYHGKMGIVRHVVERYGGEIHVEGGDIVKLDQDDCSTTVPPVGQDGLIILGHYKDNRAKVIRIERDVEVELMEGRKAGHRVILPSSHLCKHIAIN